MPAVDDYLADLDAVTRAAFGHVRDLAMETAPGAGQGVSCGLATLACRQQPPMAFRAARRHLSIFPFSSRVVEAARGRLDGFSLSSGTIRLTADRPPPDDVVRDVVRLRMAGIARRAR